MVTNYINNTEPATPVTPSVDDSLSPSDGYFNDRSPPVPQEVFVSEPTQKTETPKGKERESYRNGDSYTPYTPTSPVSNRSLGRRYRDEPEALESSPLLDNPPPAYEAATAGRSPQTQNRVSTTNQETDRIGHGINALDMEPPDMFRRGGGREPESMRGGRPSYDEEIEGRGPRLWRKCGCANFSLSRKVVRRVLLILLVLSIIGGILCGVMSGTQSADSNTCPGAHYTKTEVYDFSSKSFTFERSGSGWSRMRTGGHIDVVRGSLDTQTSAIKVELQLKSSDKNILSPNSLISKTPESITINSPSLLGAIPQNSKWAHRLNPCLAIEATVSILPNTALANFHLLLPSLSLTLASDLSVSVSNSTKISSTSSTIHFPSAFVNRGDKHVFTSRETHVHLTSGSIHGSYPLRDILDLSTVSGSVGIDVVPEAADPANPLVPAVLLISTASGSINVNFPRAYSSHPIPQRPYISTISAKSGSVNGHFFHGSETSISTYSGSVSVSIVPVSARNATSSLLTTSTQSGSQHIRLEPPVLGSTFKDLNAKHESLGSGSIGVVYPRDWEGTATAHSAGSGSLSLGGNGLDVILRERKYLQGVKGDEKKSTVECYGHGSGSIRFAVDY